MRFFIEQQSYRYDSLVEDLGRECFEQLTSRKILIQESQSRDVWSFNYVGFFYFEGIAGFVFPKLYEQSNLEGREPDLVSFYYRVLRKTSMSLRYEHKSAGGHEQDEFDNVGGLFIDLIDYYINYGLYEKQVLRKTSSLDDRVHWGRTVSSYNPLLVDGEPIYIDVHSSRTFNYDGHFITECQKLVTQKAYSELGRFILPDVKIDLQSTISIDHLLISRLTRELSSTYVDHETRLLRLLINYLNHKSSTASISDLILFGTRRFHIAWELALKQTLNDRSSELLRHYTAATWRINELDYSGSGSPRPDILLGNNEAFGVMDAKYYSVRLSGSKISGEPGVGDISKQVMYQDVAEDKGIRVLFNAFLLPSLEVSMQMTIDLEEDSAAVMLCANKQILVQFVNLEGVFQSFLDHKIIRIVQAQI